MYRTTFVYKFGSMHIFIYLIIPNLLLAPPINIFPLLSENNTLCFDAWVVDCIFAGCIRCPMAANEDYVPTDRYVN